MALGGWKKDKRKRNRFVMKALRLTLAQPKEIAERIWGKAENIRHINRKYGIRSPELSWQIGYPGWRSRAGRRKTSRAKILAFSKAEKEAILEKHAKDIKMIAGVWWKSKPVKRAFGGQYDALVAELQLFVSENLDYFDPKRVDRKGKPVKLAAWIKGGCNILCRRIYFDEIRKKERQMLLDPKGRPIQYEDLGRNFGGMDLKARSAVPYETKAILRKLGLDPKLVTELGFDDIRRMLLGIANAEETGLAEREKAVVRMRLGGKRMQEIAHSLGLKSKSYIHSIEEKAAEKIRRRLAKAVQKL